MGEVHRVEKAPLPAEGHGVRITAGATPVAVFRAGGQLYALEARCPHVGGPLDQGKLEGTRVTCPWHGSTFDIRDGSLVRGPAMKGVAAFRVRQEGEALILERA
ncbi:MAG: Rieske (2Fe-2S) protein [Thermoplasmata archaeon]